MTPFSTRLKKTAPILHAALRTFEPFVPKQRDIPKRQPGSCNRVWTDVVNLHTAESGLLNHLAKRQTLFSSVARYFLGWTIVDKVDKQVDSDNFQSEHQEKPVSTVSYDSAKPELHPDSSKLEMGWSWKSPFILAHNIIKLPVFLLQATANSLIGASANQKGEIRTLLSPVWAIGKVFEAASVITRAIVDPERSLDAAMNFKLLKSTAEDDFLSEDNKKAINEVVRGIAIGVSFLTGLGVLAGISRAYRIDIAKPEGASIIKTYVVKPLKDYISNPVISLGQKVGSFFSNSSFFSGSPRQASISQNSTVSTRSSNESLSSNSNESLAGGNNNISQLNPVQALQREQNQRNNSKEGDKGVNVDLLISKTHSGKLQKFDHSFSRNSILNSYYVPHEDDENEGTQSYTTNEEEDESNKLSY